MTHLLIEYLLRSFLNEEEFRALNVKSFQGPIHTDRTKKFVNYLKNQTALPLVKGGDSVVVDKVLILKKEDVKAAKAAGIKKKEDLPKPTEYDPVTQSDELKQILPLLVAGDKLTLLGTDGNLYPITTVAKTKELGGKGKGGTLGPERAAIAGLQSQLNEIGEPITIVFNGVSYEKITNVVNVKENQKADFAFAAGDKPLLFVSYKPGSTAKSIISYGGLAAISEKSRDVKSFVDAIKAQVDDFQGLGYEFSVPLDDKGVILKAMYGSDFGSKTYGENNVQAIMQGTITLVGKDGIYTIKADHILTSPEIPDGDYTPVLNARYAGDRNQMDIKHCRIGIVPQGARGNVKNPFDKQTKDNDQSTDTTGTTGATK